MVLMVCRIGEKLYFTTEARSHRVFLNLCTEFSVSLSLCGFKISLLRPEWSSHRRPGCCRQCQCCHQTGFRYLSHCLRSLSLSKSQSLSKSHRPARQPWLRQFLTGVLASSLSKQLQRSDCRTSHLVLVRLRVVEP